VASDLREVKKGLWLPFRVRVDVVNRVVNDFEVKRADVNVNIPDEDIDVVFPEGTIVTDEIAGTRYKVTMVPGEGQSLDRRPLSPQNPAPSAPAENAPSDAEMMKQCDSNLTQIMKGIITYQGLNNDKLPPSLAELFPKYLADPKVLICPADKSPMKIKYGLPCSYRYIGNVPLDIMLRGFIVAYDHAQHYGGRNVLYFDGHSHHASEQDFQKSLAALYEQLKPLLAKPDFPGDRDRVKAFCEDKDFPEEAWPAARPAAPAEKPK
jgi:prepilin-type processing-associated H-X9-DG protein